MAGKGGNSFDLVVLGAGPGGYPAAIRGAQNGLRVALVEAGDFGGTCLNRGCIPTKALIASAEALQYVQKAYEFGISVGSISYDYERMNQRKDRIVGDTRGKLEGLILANNISIYRGFGSFTSRNQIRVEGFDSALLHFDRAIIATGSEPLNIPAFPFDGKYIHSSTSILEITTLPKSLIIVGGGVIGSEFASMYHALGVEVTILEAMSSILPLECERISSYLTQSFREKGVRILPNVLVGAIEVDATKNCVKVAIGGERTLEADMALVAVGRKRNTDHIGLEKAQVYVTDKGEIPTNTRMETNVENIYAVGDVTRNFWLAHVASHQGLVAGNNAAGKRCEINYDAVPSVIFTEPEVATVGLTLEKALDRGFRATLSAFPFDILGKSKAAQLTEGFAQLVTDRDSGQILGAQVIGAQSSTLIAEMGIAISNELTLHSLADTIHAHPTVAEVWLEAAMVATRAPLHLPPKQEKMA